MIRRGLRHFTDLFWLWIRHNSMRSGFRKSGAVRENAGAADIELAAQEVEAIDEKLSHIEMSGVFGGSPVKK